MTNKKVIAIIVIFIMGGLFIYSFAATPSNNLKDDGTISDNGNKYMDNNKDDDKNNQKDTLKKDELVNLQKELDAAKASQKYTDESLKAMQDLIDLANKASSKEEYEKILESIKNSELTLKDDKQEKPTNNGNGSTVWDGTSNGNNWSGGNTGNNNQGDNPSGGDNKPNVPDTPNIPENPDTPNIPEEPDVPTIGNSIVSASVSSTNGTDIINISHEQNGTDIFLKGSIETTNKNYDGIYRIEIKITAPKILDEEILKNSKFKAMDNIYGIPTSEKLGYNYIENIGNIANEQAYITLSINLRGYEIKNENAPFRLAIDWGDGNFITYSVYFNSITIE